MSEPTKYLWETREPIETIIANFKDCLEQENISDDMRKQAEKLIQAASDEREQLGGILIGLYNQMPVAMAVEFLIRSGIDRHELVSRWGVAPEIALQAQRKIDYEDSLPT